ncbi:MAG: T9SS type A sorting domain-containing protein [Melioribacteraceae bacterium]|nr:T9SS type A sorting domain-containing protein [Melioribacteraceae bacterium]
MYRISFGKHWSSLLICLFLLSSIVYPQKKYKSSKPLISIGGLNSKTIDGNFKITLVAGQAFASNPNDYEINENRATYGLWSKLLGAPEAPIVEASQGTYNDKIVVSWENDLLSPPVAQDNTQVQNIFSLSKNESEIFTTSDPSQTREFIDQQVQPGTFYLYDVISSNRFGSSNKGNSIGFANASGTIFGSVKTPDFNEQVGKPVPNVQIRVTPANGSSDFVGTSVELDGQNDYLSAAKNNFILSDSAFTIETWIYLNSISGSQTIFDKSFDGNNAFKLFTEGKILKFQYGSTVVYPVNGSLTSGTWHHVAVTYDLSVMKLYVDGNLTESAGIQAISNPEAPVLIGKDRWDNFFTGNLDEMRVWSSARSVEELEKYKQNTPDSDTENMVAYWKFNEGTGNFVFDWTKNRNNLTLENSIWSSASAPVYLSAFTDNEGKYLLEGISYDYQNGTQYTVKPFKENHPNFVPQEESVLFRLLNNQNQINFIDKSEITVSGFVLFEGTNCGVDGAELLYSIIDDNGNAGDTLSFFPQKVKTNQNGEFFTTFLPETSARLFVRYNDHLIKFHPNGSQPISFFQFDNLSTPIADLKFIDYQKQNLTVDVVGGNDSFPIGAFEVKYKGSSSACSYPENVEWFIDTTDASGNLSIQNLPPLEYTLEVNHIDRPDIYSFDSGKSISLLDGDKSTKFIWYAPTELQITGLNGFIKETYKGDSLIILNQLDEYEIGVSAFEDYGNNNISFIDSGTVKITDEITGTNDPIEKPISDGKIQHVLKPHLPSFIADPSHPFQKKVSFLVENHSTGQNVTTDLWAVIIGNSLSESSSITITSPSIPYLILHTPPGDNSSAYYEKSTTNSFAISFDFGTSFGVETEVYLGIGQTATFGFVTVEQVLNNTLNVSMEGSQENGEEWITTITTNERFSTDSNSDLYIGGAFNFALGVARRLDWDQNGDSLKISEVVTSSPNGFSTTFMYTEDAIINNIIPDLLSAGTRKDSLDAITWQSIVDDNIATKARTDLEPYKISQESNNITFSAGSSYETSVSSARSYTKSWGGEFNSSIWRETNLGLLVQNAGGFVTNRSHVNFHIGRSNSETEETVTTIGFILGDDDASGDAISGRADQFSVDIFTDPVHGTPIFKTVGGQSMCPWEEGTVPREGVSLQLNPTSIVDVPPTKDAVFNLTLGNTSPTKETQHYKLSVLQESNPFGALVKINGIPIEDGIVVEIPGELNNNSVNVTMTVSRGPEAYDHEGLKIKLASLCDDFSDGPEGTLFFDIKSFNVHYIPPCSDIAVLSKHDNWIINENSNNRMEILLGGYNLDDPNLQRLVIERTSVSANSGSLASDKNEEIQIKNSITRGNVEYALLDLTDKSSSSQKSVNFISKSNNDKVQETWFESVEISVDTLLNRPVQRAYWDVTNLPDGTYKFRAKSVCRLDQIGYSQEFTGIIDRQAPQLLNEPEPVDGILDPSDQIIISFTEPIKAINAYNDSIKIKNMDTEQPIAFTWRVEENKIYIRLEVDNRFIENNQVEVSLNSIQDLANNSIDNPVVFQFYVDRNPLLWEVSNLDYTLYSSSSNKLTTRLINRGSESYDFTITNIPSWLTVFPEENNVVSAGSKEVTFTIDRNLNYGDYTALLDAETLNGTEQLRIDVRVMSDPPSWNLVAENYQYTMNITAKLFIDNLQSTDKFDMVGAFVGQDCRGLANVQEIEFDDETNEYLVLLTIYSKSISGDDIQLRVWDALDGVEYARTVESFTFQNNTTQGTIKNPVDLHATNEIFQRRDVNAGWTWISFDVERESSLLKDYLSPHLTLAEGDLIKSQTGFIQYGQSTGWAGTLSDIDLTSGYMIYLENSNLMETFGTPASPAKFPVNLNSGWTFIGYIPQLNYEINSALSSFTGGFVDDDFIKSQTEFAFYVEGYGWLGSLTHMKKSHAYFMNTTNSGTLTYPSEIQKSDSKSNSPELVEKTNIADSVSWKVEPSKFQYNMTVTAQINIGDSLDVSSNYVVGAFINDEIRGVAEPVILNNSPYFFIMIYDSVQAGSSVEFKFIDVRTEELKKLAEQVNFESDIILGNISNPFVFTDIVLGIWDEGFIPEEFSLSQNYPNPFNPETTIEFGLPESGLVEISVFNILGEKIIDILKHEMNPGYYKTNWDSKDRFGYSIPSGIYFYRINVNNNSGGNNFTDVKKMILLK